MTKEEINRAVAESVGADCMTTECRECGGCGELGGEADAYHCPRCNGTGVCAPRYIGRNYCNDLNAMHEVVCKLPDGEPRDCYLRELQIVTQTWEKVDNDEDDDWLWHSANATARQRAEAYLRAIGKWRDA